MKTEQVAIICLAVMEIVALLTDHDGALLIPIASLISGLAGYEIGRSRGSREEKREEI